MDPAGPPVSTSATVRGERGELAATRVGGAMFPSRLLRAPFARSLSYEIFRPPGFSEKGESDSEGLRAHRRREWGRRDLDPLDSLSGKQRRLYAVDSLRRDALTDGAKDPTILLLSVPRKKCYCLFIRSEFRSIAIARVPLRERGKEKKKESS